MKKIKAELEKTNPERVEGFEKGASTFVKKVVSDFKNYDCVSREESCSLTKPLTSRRRSTLASP